MSLVYRYAGASLLLFAWCRYRRLNLRFPVGEHLRFALLGLLLFGINYVVAYRAQIHITSALTAIAFSTMVWMNIFNARIFFGVRADSRVLLGALLGLAGIATLFAPQIGQLSLGDSILYGSMLAISSAYLASLGNMVSQSAQKAGLPIIQSNAWGMLYGAVATGLIAVIDGHEFRFDPSLPYVASLLYLTVFGSIIAFGAYLTLLGRIGAHKAGYAMVLFPVVALILSSVFEGLRVDAPTVAGAALVIVGNLFVLTRRRQSSPVAEKTRAGASTSAQSLSAAAEPGVSLRRQ